MDKKADMTLETIIKYILIAVVAAVILWFIFAFLLKGMGHDTVGPMINQTSKNASGALKDLFG
ncbi:hypothetical protein JW968_05345 [Candidatus Woesearchaeota archaeon]|nr:hypothetical protein [Candidatus Woesearchaeota archaeon]